VDASTLTGLALAVGILIVCVLEAFRDSGE